MRGGHSSLPYQSFLQLAVAQKCINSAWISVHFVCQRHTYADRNTLTQRSCGHFYSRNFLHIRMSLKSASQFPQTHHITDRIISPLCQRRVLHGTCMSLGQNKLVPVCFFRIGRVNIHFSEIQRRYNIRCRKRAARVAGAGIMYCANDINSDFRRQCFIFFFIHRYLFTSIFIELYLQRKAALFFQKALLPEVFLEISL